MNVVKEESCQTPPLLSSNVTPLQRYQQPVIRDIRITAAFGPGVPGGGTRNGGDHAQ